MTIRGERRKGEVLVTVDGAPLDWRSSLAVRNHSPTGPSCGYGGSGPAQLALAIQLAVTDEATAERVYQQFKWSVIAPLEADPLGAGRRRCCRLAGVGVGGDGRHRARGGGDVSSRRLLGAHLPAVFPERRETVAGECLGCQMQFAVDVRLPLPAMCPDCGGDVLAQADLEVPAPPGRPPFNALRVPEEETMTLRFIVARILRELIELAERDADAELVDALHDALDVASPSGGLEH